MERLCGWIVWSGRGRPTVGLTVGKAVCMDGLDGTWVACGRTDGRKGGVDGRSNAASAGVVSVICPGAIARTGGWKVFSFSVDRFLFTPTRLGNHPNFSGKRCYTSESRRRIDPGPQGGLAGARGREPPAHHVSLL